MRNCYPSSRTDLVPLLLLVGMAASSGSFPARAQRSASVSPFPSPTAPPPLAQSFPGTPASSTNTASPGGTIETRIPPPPGFTRVACPPNSFGAWLRALPLKPGRPPVRLHDGTLKGNQQAQYAVVEMEIGSRDLQQCADAVIRLRAEYLFGRGCGDAIQFHFTSGDVALWKDWRRGLRPSIQGHRVSWGRTAQADASYGSFRRYLDVVFTYAGSASLARELVPVEDSSRLQAGDVFIQGGSPGHAVIVVDVAENAAGDRAFVLAQSYMPAQDIHVLKSFHETNPWYPAAARGVLRTPEWIFDHGDLKRFVLASCEQDE